MSSGSNSVSTSIGSRNDSDARYEVELAERRYQAVDPANRLVAATLENRWEQALDQERRLQEEYDRFLSEVPVELTDRERKHLAELASDIPALWHAPTTTNASRKEMIRCLVNRVVVQVRCDSEFVNATIHWAGGYESSARSFGPSLHMPSSAILNRS